MQKRVVGSIELIVCTVIWGLAFVFQAIASEYLNAFLINAMRFVIAAIFLFVIVLIRNKINKNNTMNKKTLFYGLLIGIALAIASVFQQIGIGMTSTAKAGFLTSMYIIFVPIVSFFIFKKKITWLQLLGIILAVVGVGLLSLNNDFSINLGDILCLVCAIFFTAHILLTAFSTKTCDPITLSMFSFVFGAIICIIISLFFDMPSLENIGNAMPSILFLGICSSGIAYTLQMIGQKNVEEVPATLIMSLESVFSALFGFIILNQILEIKELIGCIVMLIGVIMVQIFAPGVINFKKNKIKEKEKSVN